jgi:hypothetical protein
MYGRSKHRGQACAFACLPFLLAAGAAAASETQAAKTACERSARDMFSACKADVAASTRTTVARCRTVAKQGEREACFAAAHELGREDARACREVRKARESACEVLGERRYSDPLLNPDIAFIDPADVPAIYPPNPYLSLAAGHTYVLRAGDEGEETVVVHVTDETREIEGVPCRVVLDVVLEAEDEDGETAYEAVEVTDDWMAQDELGNVYYCGEVSRNFEDGVLRDLGGSFEAGLDLARAGELIRALPAPGDAHRQEYALGEAEDIVRYENTMTAPGEDEGGDNPAFPCAPDGCLQTLEFSPLEPESSELKYYLPGIGFVLAVAIEDGEVTGEREELVCVGEGLDVLEAPECGVDDPESLREALCAQAAAFCD